MKGFMTALLSMVSLMFTSCFGCNSCFLTMDGCGEDHNDGVCDICGQSYYTVEKISDDLEICSNCVGDYGELDGCGGCF